MLALRCALCLGFSRQGDNVSRHFPSDGPLLIGFSDAPPQVTRSARPVARNAPPRARSASPPRGAWPWRAPSSASPRSSRRRSTRSMLGHARAAPQPAATPAPGLGPPPRSGADSGATSHTRSSGPTRSGHPSGVPPPPVCPFPMMCASHLRQVGASCPMCSAATQWPHIVTAPSRRQSQSSSSGSRSPWTTALA